MTKRFLLVSLLAAFVAAGAFAQMQFGIGAGYILSGRDMGAMTYEGTGWESTSNFQKTQPGGFLFLDATYAELSLGLMSGRVSGGDTFNVLSMDIGLLGRYPIRVAKITVSPLLGAGYNLVLSASKNSGADINWGKNNLPDEAGDYSTIRIMLGVGADFDVTDHVFARAGYAAHYAFAPEAIAKVVERENNNSNNNNKYSKSKSGGIGGTYTFALGYRF